MTKIQADKLFDMISEFKYQAYHEGRFRALNKEPEADRCAFVVDDLRNKIISFMKSLVI